MSSQVNFPVRVLCILWPSFLMAAVMEGLVFSVVDPSDLHWFGEEAIGWSATTVYSVSFLLFWLVISTASALTQLLAVTAPAQDLGHWPRPV